MAYKMRISDWSSEVCSSDLPLDDHRSGRVVVVGYEDDATGTMVVEGMGGRFTEVVLHPRVTVADASMVEAAAAAHKDAHEWCFIANSVNFPVRHEPTITVA